MREPADDRANQDKRDREIERVTKIPQEMLHAEQERTARRVEAQAAENVRMQKDVLQETHDEQERAHGREAWRQEQHTKRRTEEEKRRQAKLDAEREAEASAKREKERKRRQEYLDELHRNSVRKRVKQRQESALHEEELLNNAVDEQHARN